MKMRSLEGDREKRCVMGVVRASLQEMVASKSEEKLAESIGMLQDLGSENRGPGKYDHLVCGLGSRHPIKGKSGRATRDLSGFGGAEGSQIWGILRG
jgi:hypothetical protein